MEKINIITNVGIREYNSSLDSIYQTNNNLVANILDSKFISDIGWETDNLYFGDTTDWYIRKRNKNGENPIDLGGYSPIAISVIQNSNKMSSEIIAQKEKGIFIISRVDNTLNKLNSELSLLYKIDINPSYFCVKSNIDDGCFVINHNTIQRYSSDLSFVNENNTFSNIKEIAVDSIGGVFLIEQDKIHYLNAALVIQYTVNISAFISSYSFLSGAENISSIDLDRNTDIVYISGGKKDSCWIVVYDRFGRKSEFISYDSPFPLSLKVVQNIRAQTIYLLCDSLYFNKYEESSSSEEVINKKILKINKEDLSLFVELDVKNDSNISSFYISNYVDSVKSIKANLKFSFEGMQNFIPEINNIDFYEVIRKEVNFKNKDLPNGFIQVHKK